MVAPFGVLLWRVSAASYHVVLESPFACLRWAKAALAAKVEALSQRLQAVQQ